MDVELVIYDQNMRPTTLHLLPYSGGPKENVFIFEAHPDGRQVSLEVKRLVVKVRQ